MKGLISFVIEVAAIIFFGSAAFNQMYHETKVAAVKGVSKGTVSLSKLTNKMTGKPDWLEQPVKKDILRGIGKWD